MKITTLAPAQADDPGLALPVTLPAPEPVQAETPEARAERQAAESAALSGTKALLVELQSRLATVTTELDAHRQAAEQPFAGEPARLAEHLATIEQHRADAARLATEAESLKRQIPVAEQLLAKLEAEQAALESARTQAAGRVLLADALKRYVEAASNLADVVLDLGACAILANQSGSFAASVRALLLPDMPALGAALPALPGFRRQREGQTVATGDPAFQQRMNEVFSRGISI